MLECFECADPARGVDDEHPGDEILSGVGDVEEHLEQVKAKDALLVNIIDLFTISTWE